MDLSQNQALFSVGSGSRGRGLFAAADIPPNALLHIAPCLLVSKDEYDSHMKHTILEHYLFNSRTSGDKLLALGYGSLFNHSSRPNVNYQVDARALQIRYTSGPQTIQTGDELCISYGSNLWFENTENVGLSNQSVSSDEGDGVANFLGRMNLAVDDESSDDNDNNDGTDTR
jgi:SET domain-containing protein